MASGEPLIVVLGARCGGTSAVAGVLNHLGVYMGTEFGWASRELGETWEEMGLLELCSRAYTEFSDQFQWNVDIFRARLHHWAEDHRRAARLAGRLPGAKDPRLCLAVDTIRDAWNPIVPIVVDRPFGKVVASLNRLGWMHDEQERIESTMRLIAARDRALADETTIRVDFEALRAAPTDVVRRLVDDLRLEVTESQVQAAVRSIVQPVDVVASSATPTNRNLQYWLAEVERNPDDPRSISCLASTHFGLGDFVNARKWYARHVEMGDSRSAEGTYFAMYRLAEAMAQLDEPWPNVQNAYLDAWNFRPTRAEPLHAIARRHRIDGRYHLGYLFAERAAQIPLPEEDMIVDLHIAAWRATDEQAVCGGWLGKHDEAFTLSRRLLARPDLPNSDRQRIARNRDLAVPTMLEMASTYPDALIRGLVVGPRDAEVTVSLIAGPDPTVITQTLNSFLHCCTDVSRVGRFLIVDAGLSTGDRATFLERYRFVEFAEPGTGAESGDSLARVRAQVRGRFWLHVGSGWHFFAPENLITRLTAVLEAESQVFQVGVNVADEVGVTGECAAESTVRRTPDAGRYVLTDRVASGPAMFDTARLDDALGSDETRLSRPADAGLITATLDEVLCINAVPAAIPQGGDAAEVMVTGDLARAPSAAPSAATQQASAAGEPTDLARYLRIYPGAIDDSLIADLIALPGATPTGEAWRRCTQAPVVGDALDRLRRVVRECFADYRSSSDTLSFCTRLEQPNVLRYEPSASPNQREHEHADAWDIASATRQVSVIAYLNDVVRGGETVFPRVGHVQRCEKGTILLYPSNFLFHHYARPPESNRKVVVTTWLHFGNDGVTTYLTSPLG